MLYPIKSWANQQLFSIWLWGNKLVFRKSLPLLRPCLALLDAEIRSLDTSLQQVREREDEDYIVEFVARDLTNREQLETNLSAAANMSELALSLREKALADTKVREAVGIYFLCQAYAYGQFRKTEEEQGALLTASRFIPNANALTAKGIYEIFASQSKRYKELRALLAERSAVKIQVAGSDYYLWH